MKRRTIIQAAALAAFVPAAGISRAEAGTIRIVVPFAPGGSGDITARLLGQYLTDKGRKVLVDNKPGANGIIGVEAAKAAPADGQTLLLATTSTHAANPSLFRKLPYDPEKDFSLVGVFGSGGSYMLVRPDAPYRTLADFVARAKAAPGKLNYGHFNASSNVPGALMGTYAGVQLTAVPYKEIGRAITELLSGQIDVLFVDTTAGDSYVSSGQLRPLAVTSGKRLARYPDLPALAETYPGFEVIGFLGVAVASAAPEAVKQQLNDLVNDAVMSEPMHGRIESFGFTVRRMNLQECAALGHSERLKWQRYVATAKIDPQ